MGSGLLGVSKPPTKGLLKPVIFDKVRGEDGRQGRLQLGGGGGGGWTPSWHTSPSGRTVSTVTPSGRAVEFKSMGDPGRTEVLFHGSRGTSLKGGIGKLSDVYRAVKSYVDTFQPRTLEFVAATRSHQNVYDRLAPRMARELDAEIDWDDNGSYIITLPGWD